MKVFVIMGNDYPDRVFAKEEDAKAFCNQKAKDPTNRIFGHPRIFWRYYEFELHDKYEPGK